MAIVKYIQADIVKDDVTNEFYVGALRYGTGISTTPAGGTDLTAAGQVGAGLGTGNRRKDPKEIVNQLREAVANARSVLG